MSGFFLETDCTCPDCGTRLTRTRYELKRVGVCPSCADTTRRKLKEHKADLSKFLSIQPIDPSNLAAYADGMPVWIETYAGADSIVAFADVMTSFVNGRCTFLSELSFPIGEYNVTWRIWPCFKAFRPSREESLAHPWRTAMRKRMGLDCA